MWISDVFFIWLQGWLPGLKTGDDAHQLPTIAIVASYDTFGAAPVCDFINSTNNTRPYAMYDCFKISVIVGIISGK